MYSPAIPSDDKRKRDYKYLFRSSLLWQMNTCDVTVFFFATNNIQQCPVCLPQDICNSSLKLLWDSLNSSHRMKRFTVFIYLLFRHTNTELIYVEEIQYPYIRSFLYFRLFRLLIKMHNTTQLYCTFVCVGVCVCASVFCCVCISEFGNICL